MSSDAEAEQLEPILLRYVSSPSKTSTFDIRFERSRNETVSSSLHRLELHSSKALWALACGMFNVGKRIHLCCGGTGPKFAHEPCNAPLSSSCHHLVGLYNWRILSVRETHDLIKIDADNAAKENRWITLQVHVFFYFWVKVVSAHLIYY